MLKLSEHIKELIKQLRRTELPVEDSQQQRVRVKLSDDVEWSPMAKERFNGKCGKIIKADSDGMFQIQFDEAIETKNCGGQLIAEFWFSKLDLENVEES